MPYIKQSDREKYTKQITEAVEQIILGPEPDHIKGELFGYWANRLVKKYVQDPRAEDQTFNSSGFNKDKVTKVSANADRLAVLIGASSPTETAGDLNFCLSAVYWGILGDDPRVKDARYGMRAYLKGILHKIMESVTSRSTGSQSDAAMSFRRHLVAKGVLSDVMDEAYARKTRIYEDGKIRENGDLWNSWNEGSP